MRISPLSKKMIKNILKFFILMVIFSSCHSKKENYFQANMELNIVESQAEYIYEQTNVHWDFGTNKKIIVLFGYGFNNEDFVEKSVLHISQKFGLAENSGLVIPVVYPDDLRNRIMNLAELTNQNDIQGIILLGSPERTHFALAKIHDQWDNLAPFNICSFFPQDDILGQEGTATFVLEVETSSVAGDEITESEYVFTEKFIKVLSNSIEYLAGLPFLLEYNSELEKHIMCMIKYNKVQNYVDNETGLTSRNHFIVSKEIVN